MQNTYNFDYSHWTHDPKDDHFIGEHQQRKRFIVARHSWTMSSLTGLCFVFHSLTPPWLTGSAGQEQVYQDVGIELLDHSFEGYNCCIFA